MNYSNTNLIDDCIHKTVSCIDRQIEELQARKYAILHGYCYIGHLTTKTFLDPYNLVEEEKKNDRI